MPQWFLFYFVWFGVLFCFFCLWPRMLPVAVLSWMAPRARNGNKLLLVSKNRRVFQEACSSVT